MSAKKQVPRKEASAKEKFEQLQKTKQKEARAAETAKHQEVVHRRHLVGEYMIMCYGRSKIPYALLRDHKLTVSQRVVDRDIAEVRKQRNKEFEAFRKTYSMDQHWRDALENADKILEEAWKIAHFPGEGTGTSAQALKIIDEQWERRRMCLAALGMKATESESEAQKKNFLVIGYPAVGDSIRQNPDGSITFLKGQ